MSDAKSSVAVFELSAGYLDTDGTLYDFVEMKEMTGVEEDILASKNREGDVKLGLVLRNVTEAFVSKGVEPKRITDKEKIHSIITSDLTSADIMAMLIALRQVSLGNLFRMNVKCPNKECGEELEYDINLASMAFIPAGDKKQRKYDVILPSGKKITMTLLTRKDEVLLEKAKKKGEEVLSYSIMARTKAIGEDIVITLEKVQAFSYLDRQKIRKEYVAHEAGLDTEVEITCRGCENKFVVDLDISQPSFFFPSEM